MNHLAYQQAKNAADLLELVSRVPVEVMLEAIDREQVAVGQHVTLQNGPFRVFRGQTVDFGMESRQSPFQMDSWTSPLHNLDNALVDPILRTSTYKTHSMASSLQEERPQLQEAFDDILSQDEGSSAIAADFPSFISSLIPIELSPECAADVKDIDMSTVKLLLDHYQNTLVPRLTPAEVPYKSPWKTLYIPNILSTVGDIVLSGNGSNAKVSLMFSALAISAFNLHGLEKPNSGASVSQARDWSELGRLYRERATKRLKSSLLVLSSTQTKKEKYKDILMALLSMITICVSSHLLPRGKYSTH